MNIKKKISAFAGDKISTYTADKTNEQEPETTSKNELLVITLILTEQLVPGKSVPIKKIIDSMESEGYKKLESSIALRSLKNKDMIDLYDSYDEKTNNTYAACSITEKGEEWIVKNKSLFNDMDDSLNNHENGGSKLNKQFAPGTSNDL